MLSIELVSWLSCSYIIFGAKFEFSFSSERIYFSENQGLNYYLNFQNREVDVVVLKNYLKYLKETRQNQKPR